MVEPVPVYSVNPDRVTIAPKSSCQLEFFGFSAPPGQIEERFICSLGSGVKSKQTIFDIVARCDTPLRTTSHTDFSPAHICPPRMFCGMHCLLLN